MLYIHQINGSKRHLLNNLLIADSFVKRMIGLLGNDVLDESSGLLITPCNLIHTFGMKFKIDVIFLDKNRRILNCRTNVPKNRVHGQLNAKHTMELSAGSVDRFGLRKGDELVWQ